MAIATPELADVPDAVTVRTGRPPASLRPGAYEPLVPVALAAIAGIVVDRYLPLPPRVTWSAACGLLAVWLALWALRRGRSSAVVLLLSIAALSAAWHHVRWQWFSPVDLSTYAGEAPCPAVVEVVALDQARLVPPAPYDPLRIASRGDRTRFTVRAVAIRSGTTWLPAAGRTQVTIDGELAAIGPGDRLRVDARLACPAPPGNPGQFDFAAHQRAERRLCELRVESPAAVQVLSRGSAWRPARWMAAARRAADRFLCQYLPPTRAGLAGALLLGLRDQVGQERTDAYLRTGTIHVLSISGMHVAIVAGTLFGLLRLGWLPLRTAAAAIAAITALYAWLAGAEPPVVRAAVLVGIACLAMWLGRRALSWNGLAAAAILVLAVNPADLFRVGPQLSFLCVGALVWFGPRTRFREPRDPLDLLIWRTRPWHVRALRTTALWAAQLTILGFWVWLVSLPLVAARFHLISPAAPLLNTLLWIPVTLVLVAGLVMLVLATIIPPLAGPVASLCATGLALMDRIVAWAAQLPASHFWVAGPSDAWLVPLYVALVAWALLPGWRPARSWRIALLFAWAAGGVVAPAVIASHGGGRAPWGRLEHGQLRCTFLAVGHGCAAVVELPDGRTLVYDCGQLGSPAGAASAVSGTLWQYGRGHIDALVLSHADVDHFNGVPDLLDRVAVGAVYAPPGMFAEPGAALVDLAQSLRQANLPAQPLCAGMSLADRSDLKVAVLHPPVAGVPGSDNAQSIVLSIEFQGRRIVLTGDLEGAGVEDLLAQTPLDCDVLLAPHHGSARSDPPGLAGWSTPEWLVISGGREEPSGQLIDAYTASGAHILRTATHGAIQCTIADGQLTVRTFRAPHE